MTSKRFEKLPKKTNLLQKDSFITKKNPKNKNKKNKNFFKKRL